MLRLADLRVVLMPAVKGSGTKPFAPARKHTQAIHLSPVAPSHLQICAILILVDEMHSVNLVLTRSPEKRGLSVFAMRVTEVTEWMDVYEESVFPFSIANVLTILLAMILHALIRVVPRSVVVDPVV